MSEQEVSINEVLEFLKDHMVMREEFNDTRKELDQKLSKQKHELMNFVEERLEEKIGELKKEFKGELKREIGSVRNEIGSVRNETGSVRKDLKETRNELMGITTRLVNVLEKKEVLNKQDVKEVLPVSSFLR